MVDKAFLIISVIILILIGIQAYLSKYWLLGTISIILILAIILEDIYKK